MREEYNFENSVKNPYARKLKQEITIRLETDAVEYFKELAAEIDIPYQKLINLFLRSCAEQKMKPTISWSS